MKSDNSTTLHSFRTLGHSGLVVSPLALGTMTFGTPRWGSDEQVSKSVFNHYVNAGAISSTPPTFTPKGAAKN